MATGYVDPECEARVLLEGVESYSARRIVTHHLGADGVLSVPKLRMPGCLSVVHGRYRVAVRSGLPPVALRWVLMHELAEWHLARLGYAEDDTETVAEAIAAALVLPRAAFVEELRDRGPAFSDLASAFDATPTAAALRFGEVTGTPTLVASPAAVRVRGEAWAWPASETECRQLARAGRPGLRRAELGDRRRTAIYVDERAA